MTALIILIYNNADSIRDFVESFERYNTAPVKYIVVDNGSKPEVTESVSVFLKQAMTSKGYQEVPDGYSNDAPLPYCTYLRSKTNSGFSGGNNKGLRLAYKDSEVDNVFVVNDDLIFVDDILPRLVNALRTLPRAGMICPISLLPNRGGWTKHAFGRCVRYARSLSACFATFGILTNLF